MKDTNRKDTGRRKFMRRISGTVVGTSLIGSVGLPTLSGSAVAATDGDASSYNSQPYAGSYDKQIHLQTEVKHLGTKYYESDETYSHKYCFVGDSVCTSQDDYDDKKQGITNHMLEIDGTDTSYEHAIYSTSSNPEVAAYPAPSTADDAVVVADTVKAAASALNGYVSVAVAGAEILENIMNFVSTDQTSKDYVEYFWNYQTSVTDACHHVKCHIDHPYLSCPKIIVRSRSANTAYNEFTITLGSNANASPNSSTLSVDGQESDAEPIPAPSEMTEEQRELYDVEKIPQHQLSEDEKDRGPVYRVGNFPSQIETTNGSR